MSTQRMTDLALNIPAWTLGDRLRKARIDRGISRAAMGRVVNRTAGGVGHWETGVHTPTLDGIERWAEVTQVYLWWLLGYDSDPGRSVMIADWRGGHHDEDEIRNSGFRSFGLSLAIAA